MNKKYLITLTIISLILALFVLYPYLSEKYFSEFIGEDNLSFSIDMSSINSNDIDGIILGSGGDEVIFAKVDDNWQIMTTSTAMLPADSEKIVALVSEFREIDLKEIISKNPENYIAYGVDDEMGMYVKFLRKEENLSKFYVGGDGSIPETFYIREEGIPFVYVASGDIMNLISVQIEDWKAQAVTSTEYVAG